MILFNHRKHNNSGLLCKHIRHCICVSHYHVFQSVQKFILTLKIMGRGAISHNANSDFKICIKQSLRIALHIYENTIFNLLVKQGLFSDPSFPPTVTISAKTFALRFERCNISFHVFDIFPRWKDIVEWKIKIKYENESALQIMEQMLICS